MPDLNFDGHNTLYATHGLHAYAAKCPPQLVRYALTYYSQRGDTVLDPMVGSGTTLVESRRLGRNSIGVDMDPLACLIAEVKSTPLEDREIGDAFDHILRTLETNGRCASNASGQLRQPKRWRIPEFHNRDYWFTKDVLRALTKLSSHIAQAPVNQAIRKFFWVAFSSLILSKSSVANARDIIHSRHHHCEKICPPDVIGRFKTRVKIMRRQMADFVARCRRSRAAVHVAVGDARSLGLPRDSIDLIFTSPPYATALDYTRAQFLAVPWMANVLGVGLSDYLRRGAQYVGTERGRLPGKLVVDPSLAAIGQVSRVLEDLAKTSEGLAKRIHRYFLQMTLVLQEMARVLKPGKPAILVVCPSHLRRVQVPTHSILDKLGNSLGLRLQREYTRTINERRRLLPYVSAAFGERMDLEYILIFRKQ